LTESGTLSGASGLCQGCRGEKGIYPPIRPGKELSQKTSCGMTHLSSGSLPYAESFLEPLLARLRWELRPVTEQLLETKNQHS